MPRHPRAFAAGQTLHVIQRGNNRSACFACDTDRATYLTMLHDLAVVTGCALHAYVLMTNHVHLLLTARESASASALVKRLGQRYSALTNRKYQRTGSLWECRFRASPVTSDAYVLACYQYIELNPVRAGMVATPEEYRWSSHRANVGLERLDPLVPHPTFAALSCAGRDARTIYRGRFGESLDPATIADIRAGRAQGAHFAPVSDTGVQVATNCNSASLA